MPKIAIEASADKVQAYLEARDRLAAASGRKMSQYLNDPVAFIRDCVAFPDGQSLTAYQEEVIAALPVRKRVTQVGPHGLGKTTSAALLVLWFALTRDAAQIDWKAPITAGAWRQLEQYLMPEIHKWARFLRWDKIGREPFRRGELLTLNLNLNFGSAFAVASNVPSYIEGAHADHILYVFDESKSIIDATFDAAEGAFSGSGTDGREAFALASSTPGEPVGRFYDLHQHKKGLEDWWTRHVTLEESITEGRINRDWAEQRKAQWGEDSQLYANRVLGQFHASDEDSVIPLSWIEAAVERSYESQHLRVPLLPMDRVGVDVARGGQDKTVIAPIHGHRIEPLKYSFHEDTVMTKNRVVAVLAANPKAVAIIDADGLGVGVYDSVRAECGQERCAAFHAATTTDWRDASGEMSYNNTRSAAWFKFRELLDPARGAQLELPDDDQLTADLSTPKWKETTRGRIAVESKDDIKKRLSGRSPDAADACVMGTFVQRKRRRRRMGSMGWGEKDKPPTSGEDAVISA